MECDRNGTGMNDSGDNNSSALCAVELKMLSTEGSCCMKMFTLRTNFSIQANSLDPKSDCSLRSSLIWVHTVCYRDSLKTSTDNTQQMTYSHN